MDISQNTVENQNYSPVLNPVQPKSPMMDDREKLKKWKSVAIFVLVILVIIVILSGVFIYKIKNFVYQGKNDSLIRKIDELPHRVTGEKQSILKTETKLMSFVRNGDIWIKNIKEGQEEKITNHPELKIKARHPSLGRWFTTDYSNEFYQRPKISPDGRLLIYLGINKNIFEELKKYETQLATESAEVQKSGDSIAFLPPRPSYSWNIYDLNRRVYIEPAIDTNIKNDNGKMNEVLSGPFGSMEWLNQTLTLSFISGLNSYALKVSYSQDETPTVIITNTGNNTCGLICGMSNGQYSNDLTDFWVRSSPDGMKLLLAQSQLKDVTNARERALIPSGCGDPAFAEETLVIDNAINKFINFSKTDLCRIYARDWYKDNQNFIQLENYTDGSDWFVNRNILNASLKPNKLFQDGEFFSHSPIYLSPDNKYIAYFSGKYEAENTGERDLRIRNLTTNNYFDVVEITQEQTNLIMNRIAYPCWDANSKNIYFKISTDNNLGCAIKFDVEKREAKVIAKDIDQLNMN